MTIASALRDEDLAACKAILRAGSKSFAAASMMLPKPARGPCAALYAFCRVADDAVDEGGGAAAVATLRTRLDNAYAATPEDTPVDRALSAVVLEHRIPRAALDGLIEGFAWDAEGRRYPTLSALLAYAARVASTVGVMMTALLGPRDPATIARACELGLAMQLTNIARDVGEDARAGRLYLPLAWLEAEAVDVEAWLSEPVATPAIRRVVERLLVEADRLYASADLGIPRLPGAARPAIRAARLVYADIGRVVRANGCDSVSSRATVSPLRKIALCSRALFPRRAEQHGDPSAPPLDEVRFLIDAIAAP